MLLALTQDRRPALAALTLAVLFCIPSIALAAPARHGPADDSSLLCDLLGIFCGPDSDSDRDHTPPVPGSGVVGGHRSADTEKSFPADAARSPPLQTLAPPPPPPPPTSPEPGPRPPR